MSRPSVRQFTLVFLLALVFVSPMIKAMGETTPDELWLYVEDAAGGSLTGPDDQHLKLKLKKLRKNITAMTAGNDTPQVHVVPNEEFFDDWLHLFPQRAATASLSYDLHRQQRPLDIVLTLTNPHYDADERTVMFDAVRITDIPCDPHCYIYDDDYIRYFPVMPNFTDATLTFVHPIQFRLPQQ